MTQCDHGLCEDLGFYYISCKDYISPVYCPEHFHIQLNKIIKKNMKQIKIHYGKETAKYAGTTDHCEICKRTKKVFNYKKQILCVIHTKRKMYRND